VGGRLDTLEADKETLISTTVRASDLKELENYMLERLGIQVINRSAAQLGTSSCCMIDGELNNHQRKRCS